jgi:CBS domain-containing protein
MLIRNHMMLDPVTVRPDTPVAWAAELMEHYAIADLAVVDERSTLVGMVCERDILKAAASFGGTHENLCVADVMQSEFPTIDANASIAEALKLFCEHKCSSLPVIARESLVGLISQWDVMDIMYKFLSLDRDGGSVEVALIEYKDDLARAFQALRDCDADVISVVAAGVRDDGEEAALYLRVDRDKCRQVERSLARAGMILLEPENHTNGLARHNGERAGARTLERTPTRI